jgi:hypothetical protein
VPALSTQEVCEIEGCGRIRAIEIHAPAVEPFGLRKVAGLAMRPDQGGKHLLPFGQGHKSEVETVEVEEVEGVRQQRMRGPLRQRFL